MAGLGLKSIAYMAEKFPDKWMEKIPYYRAKEEEMERDERDARRSRKHSRRHSHSHKSSRSHRRDDYDDEEEPSDDYSGEEYDRRDRRRHRSLDGRRHEEDGRSSNRRSYNPADYVPVDRYGYYPAATAHPAANANTATTSFADGSRPTSTSGPTPGYIPYAHVYSTPGQSQHTQSTKPYHTSADTSDYPYGRDARDSLRGTSDRHNRRDHRAEPRNGRYTDSRYDSGTRNSRDYDSDSDIKYRGRRHD